MSVNIYCDESCHLEHDDSLLITAFYLDYEHALKKKLDKFNKYKLEN